MSLVHGLDSNLVLRPLLLDASGRPLVSARLYNAADVAIQTDAAGDLIVAGKDGAGTAHILRMDANGQPMISALDTGGSARQLRCSTTGDLIAGGRDAAANGYPLRTDNTGELNIQGHLLNKVFAYKAAVNQAAQNLNLAAGANNLDLPATPANQVYVLTNIAVAYVGTVTNVVLNPQITDGATSASIYNVKPPVSGVFYDRQGWWPVPAGFFFRCVITGATLGDDGYIAAYGFAMDV